MFQQARPSLTALCAWRLTCFQGETPRTGDQDLRMEDCRSDDRQLHHRTKLLARMQAELKRGAPSFVWGCRARCVAQTRFARSHRCRRLQAIASTLSLVPGCTSAQISPASDRDLSQSSASYWANTL